MVWARRVTVLVTALLLGGLWWLSETGARSEFDFDPPVPDVDALSAASGGDINNLNAKDFSALVRYYNGDPRQAMEALASR